MRIEVDNNPLESILDDQDSSTASTFDIDSPTSSIEDKASPPSSPSIMARYGAEYESLYRSVQTEYGRYKNTPPPIVPSFPPIPEPKPDEPQISLSELVDLMGVAPGKNTAIRASHGGVSSIYYEEESKNSGIPKGFTSLNLYYSQYSKKNLFDTYHDYKNEQLTSKAKEILSFSEWARDHFELPTPPLTWQGDPEQLKQTWGQTRQKYIDFDLITLTAEQRQDFEVRIIDGLCYINTGEPYKVHIPGSSIERDNQTWGLMDSAAGLPRQSLREKNLLIYVLAEDQKGEKRLFAACDVPGIFHHSSFNDGSLKILSAGTMIVQAGVIQGITDESGHYRPTQSNFANVIDFLESRGAITQDLNILQHTKTMVTDQKLYLVANFDPKKCDIQGNAVILDNKNNAYFVNNGQVVMRKDLDIPQSIAGINRLNISLSTSEKPEPAASSKEKMDKIVRQAALLGGEFKLEVTPKIFSQKEVTDFRKRTSAQSKWQSLAKNISSGSFKKAIDEKATPSPKPSLSKPSPITLFGKSTSSSPEKTSQKTIDQEQKIGVKMGHGT